ncbi:Signal transduction histidine kinase [Nocardioides exalbidus]|uniref:Sensor-like histidine kinase SenX3 n=1 Tax=Nocardioides exalbidus TaxID=402596 RepID=A0A1H4K5Q1_9ACTN|nr:ATP-binding protein [Nocardioides exalbidus]SEB53707.1 Signal transduction histidine kinase [Nocardioides exalbidus]
MLDETDTARPRDGLAILAEGVDALAEFGGEDAYELLQEVARVAAGSDAAHTGIGRNQGMVDTVGVLLAAHMRASARRRVERRRTQLRNAVAEVVEAAVKDRDVERVISEAVRVLQRVMDSQLATIQAFGSDDPMSAGRDYGASHPPEVEDLITPEVVERAGLAAQVCWERQTASLHHLDEPDAEPLTTPEGRDFALGFMRTLGAREMLLAPLGADGRCVGWIVLTRADGHEPFSLDDVDAVLAIGREVGNAVRHAQAFERQVELIDQLRELSNYKSWFTATLAHQLRNPLTSISLHLDELTALRDGRAGTPAEVSGGLEAIERSARIIEDSVESLLSLARLEEPGKPAARELVDLDLLVMRCADAYERIARSGGVELETSDVAAGTQVTGDAGELEMIVDNVLGNAVKYSSAGGVVRLGVCADGDGTLLTCSDDGIGMGEHDLALMFSPFHRATEAHDRRIPGSGLGLAIVKAAVDRHGGTIRADSAPGRGTRIEIRLPTLTRG